MHRDRRLRPFSRDHHHVLALARRLEQATHWSPSDADELTQRMEHELGPHLAGEAELLVPALEAAGGSALAAELTRRHRTLRELAAVTPDLDAAWHVGSALSEHVRWEERELLPWCEQHLSDEALDRMETFSLQMQRAPDRAPLPRHQLAETLSEDVLRVLVDTFYARVREDRMLGPVFNDAVHDWPAHLHKLTQFWSRVMLGTQAYTGNPMVAHSHHRERITPAHFAQWLALWKQITEQVLAPPLACSLQERAERMAEGLQAGLSGARMAPRETRYAVKSS